MEAEEDVVSAGFVVVHPQTANEVSEPDRSSIVRSYEPRSILLSSKPNIHSLSVFQATADVVPNVSATKLTTRSTLEVDAVTGIGEVDEVDKVDEVNGIGEVSEFNETG